ncbi:flagellar basal body rod protein FlgB [Bacillus timonensis]|uniref:Flagellar basal body rod protein FlgB n=1 Tax=Bacillus timonensis TaxID=1033734 RepID=A0A4V3V8D2_9BACI|nr:flagellar basal body rod protein FlgB [Bacillus timonensis]THE14463.1 flagellar basal body rod protein FlgB [Bacillus timonensis]
MKLFSNTIHSLEKALDNSALRQKVISNNIANVDTPNYKAQDVSFKNLLSNEMNSPLRANRTNEKHFEFTSSKRLNSQVVTKNDTAYNHNGNNVDIDKEMALLAENQIYYNAVTERISGKFNTLKTVIKGGN